MRNVYLLSVLVWCVHIPFLLPYFVPVRWKLADSMKMAELEKLGPKYRIALRIARDERFERLQCDHKGVYADDCIVDRVMKSKIYIVATNDRDLKRRVRKVPGVPIMSVARGKYVIERLPDAPEK